MRRRRSVDNEYVLAERLRKLRGQAVALVQSIDRVLCAPDLIVDRAETDAPESKPSTGAVQESRE